MSSNETKLDKTNKKEEMSSDVPSSVDSVLNQQGVAQEFIKKITSLSGEENKYEVNNVVESIGSGAYKNLSFDKMTSSISEKDSVDLIKAMNHLKAYVESFNARNDKSVWSKVKNKPLIKIDDEKLLPGIISTLETSYNQLLKDEENLAFEKKSLQTKTELLKEDLSLLKLIEKEISLLKDDALTDALYYLRKKIIDLTQALQVTLQAIAVSKVLEENNKSLLLAASHARTVTIPALRNSVNLDRAMTSQERISESLTDLKNHTESLVKNKIDTPPVPKVKPPPQGTFREVHKFAGGSKMIEVLDLNAWREEKLVMQIENHEWEEYLKSKDRKEKQFYKLNIYSFVDPDGIKSFTFGVRQNGTDLPFTEYVSELKGRPISTKNHRYLGEFLEVRGLNKKSTNPPAKTYSYGHSSDLWFWSACLILGIPFFVITFFATKDVNMPRIEIAPAAQILSDINPIVSSLLLIFLLAGWADFFSASNQQRGWKRFLFPVVTTALSIGWAALLFAKGVI